jgi:thiol-disulfide isomerase/thioredoxin
MSTQPKSRRTAIFALLLIGLFLALEYAWMESPHRGKPRRPAGSWLTRARTGCPADSADRGDYGRADAAWNLTTLDGETVAFEQFRGKVVFVNVWATWCGPCVDEMPDIQSLYESMRGTNVAFVLVSEEEIATVRGFVDEQQLNAPVYVSAGSLPDVFESRGIPATFIVAADGQIVFKKTGAARWDSDVCRNYLRGLLPPASPQPSGTASLLR